MYYNHYCIFRICNLITSSSSQHGCVEYDVANNVDISSIISGADETEQSHCCVQRNALRRLITFAVFDVL